jgi:hypothetical protein
MNSLARLTHEWLNRVGIAVDSDAILEAVAANFAAQATDLTMLPAADVEPLEGHHFPPLVRVTASLLADAHRGRLGAREALATLLKATHRFEDVLGHPGDELVVRRLRALASSERPWVSADALSDALTDLAGTRYPRRAADWLAATERRRILMRFEGRITYPVLVGSCINVHGDLQPHEPDHDSCNTVWYAETDALNAWVQDQLR